MHLKIESHFSPLRLLKHDEVDNSKVWQGHGEISTDLYCLWEDTLVWNHGEKFGSFNTFLGTFPKYVQKYICKMVLIMALYIL